MTRAATAFTVIVPTYDHVESLWFSLETVFAQTLQDFEVVVVGDGAPGRSADIVRAFAARDPRIRYAENAKGARNGEVARHRALARARGKFVAYLCDDDLWFPEHLETLAGLLADHDLAHTMQIDYAPGGISHSWMFDADADPTALDAMRRNENGFGLASGGHTLEAYKRLPFGWRPAPHGVNSDTYFWLQLLEQPWCRYASHKWPGVIHLSQIPAAWSAMRRAAEVAAIAARLSDPAWREQLVQRTLAGVHDRVVRDAALATAQLVLAAARPYQIGELVRFGLRGTAFRYAVTGTHELESWGVWANGAMRIVLPRAGETRPDGDRANEHLRLTVALVHFLAETSRPASAVTISVNGEIVAHIEERRTGAHQHRIDLPRSVSTGAESFVVEIEGENAASPRSLQVSADPRELSVGVVSLAIEAVSVSAERPSRADQRSASAASHSGAKAP